MFRKTVDDFGNKCLYVAAGRHKRFIFRKRPMDRWRFDGWYDPRLEEVV